jgi:hypothetical protein
MAEERRNLILRFINSPSDPATTKAEEEAKVLAATTFVGADDGLRRYVNAARTVTVRVVAAHEVYDLLVESHVSLRHARPGKSSSHLRRIADGIHILELGWIGSNCRVCHPPASAATPADVNTAISAGLALGGRGWAGGASSFSAADKCVRVVLLRLDGPDAKAIAPAAAPAAATAINGPCAAPPVAAAAAATVTATALYIQDPATKLSELHAPSAPTPTAYAACILRWVASHGPPHAVHVGIGLDGKAVLQALGDTFGVPCECRGALPLVLQQPADVDIGPIVCNRLHAWTAQHPEVHWRDALAAVAIAMNAAVGINVAAAASISASASAKGRHVVGASRAAAPRAREVIEIDSDSDDHAESACGSAGKRHDDHEGDAPCQPTTAAPTKRRRVAAPEGITCPSSCFTLVVGWRVINRRCRTAPPVHDGTGAGGNKIPVPAEDGVRPESGG